LDNDPFADGSGSSGENREHGVVHHLPRGEHFEFWLDLGIAILFSLLVEGKLSL
jgi:hypothetical protein